jgi:hypothetical protein
LYGQLPLAVASRARMLRRLWVSALPEAGGCCNPGDLTRWKEHDAYSKAFDRLLRDLRVRKA